MSPTADRQLGADLRRFKPAGADPQVMQSMVRDLLGADQLLLAPLLHLLGQPAFMALDPLDSSSAVRMAGRDSLLLELAETYHPRLLQRLGDFLDGYLDLLSHSVSADDALAPMDEAEPAPSPDMASPSAPGFVSQAVPATSPAPPQSSAQSSSASAPVPDPWGPAPVVGATASAQCTPAEPRVSADPSGPIIDPSPPDAAQSGSRRPLAIATAAGLGLVIALSAGVAALRNPQLCRLFGACESPQGSRSASSASERALQAGEAAVKALQAATDLPSYRGALEDLDNQLLRLSGDPLDADQQQRRNRLQERSQQGQARLKQENSDAAVVSEARERIDALPSQPAASAEANRTQIRRSLSAIPSISFSHGEAQVQLRRLEAVTGLSEPPTAEPPTAVPAPSAVPPASEPAPAPAPRPRSVDRSQEGGGGWNAPPQRPAPAPAPAPTPPQDDGASNAPYRSEPLF